MYYLELQLLIVIALGSQSYGQRRRCTVDVSEFHKELSTLSSVQAALYDSVAALHTQMASLAAVAAGALPEDCSVAKRRGAWGPFHMISPPGIAPRMVRCDMTTEGGRWTVALWREPIAVRQHHGPYDSYGDSHRRSEAREAEGEAGEGESSNSYYSARSDELNLSALRTVKDPDRPNRNDLPLERNLSDDLLYYGPHPSNRGGQKNRERRSQSTQFLRENFNRTWSDYKEGFGHHTGEYWIGNDVLHALTTVSTTPWEALIVLKDKRGNNATAFYGEFRVSDESGGYRLHADKYHEKISSAGDGLAFHHQRSFSTYDRDNDEYHGSHCGQDYGAGWWFHQCHVSLLTGAGKTRTDEGAHTLHWRNWRGEEALHSAALMIRPKLTEG